MNAPNGRAGARDGRIARWLVRGPDASHILEDLAELRARDLARGVPRWRARLRYARNLIGSAWAVRRPGLPRLRVPAGVWLDVKLAARLLRKQPGLTVVTCIVFAIGIPVALAPFQLVAAINGPLPFDRPKDLLGIEYWDQAASDQAPVFAQDFETWRDAFDTFEGLGAFRSGAQNLVGDDGRAELVRGSEMTGSVFGLLRVKPLLGRMLVEADERPGAQPVVVIGYDLWQTRFGGDPAAIGQSVRLGRTRRTVVGVMPRGFLFPLREAFWVPLRVSGIEHGWRDGPAVRVFGRLREGATRERAEAEAAAVGARAAADHPDTNATMRVDVVPLPHMLTGLRADSSRAWPVYTMALLLLTVTCGNIGTLMLARLSSRSRDIAVRTALGATRASIVLQLFIESLLPAALAAALGLVVADRAVENFSPLGPNGPFWFDLGVRPFTVAVAAVLVVFSAAIAGALPALRATGRNVQRSLQRAGAGRSGLRFGGIATLLIVAEVAIAVAGLSGVVAVAGSALRRPGIGPIATDAYLTAQLRLAVEPSARDATGTTDDEFVARFGSLEEELTRRLEAEPGVLSTTYASRLPGMDHPTGRIEVEGIPSAAYDGGWSVRQAWIDPTFFDVLDQPILGGRGFDRRDTGQEVRPLIVNRTFVEQVLGGASAVGRRVRSVDSTGEPGPWREIIGVVNDLGMNAARPELGAGMYTPIAPGERHPMFLLVRPGGDPAAFVPRLRAIASSVEPLLLVDDPAPLTDVVSELLWEARLSSVVFALIAVIAILLSTAGLYALMSFTVSERTREIGIRIALGARRSSIARIVATRSALQLALGVAGGVWLGVFVVGDLLNSSIRTQHWPLTLAAVAAIMGTAGLVACLVPTARAMRIPAVRALRDN